MNEPSKRLPIQRNDAGRERTWGKVNGDPQDRDGAPDNQNHHHHGGNDHDLYGLLARLVNTLRILPPEVNRDQSAKCGGKGVFGEVGDGMARSPGNVLNKPGKILSGDHRADRSGEHVIEEQGRDREFSKRPAHGFLDHAVNTAADKHAARFDVERSHRIAEQHNSENEPGSALADDLFGIASGVVGGRCEVRQHDGGSAPEGDEGQHHRGSDEDPYGRFGTCGCSHASMSARAASCY